MDEIQMVRSVYPEPAPPTAREIARARALLSESPRRLRPRSRLGGGRGAIVACAAAAAAAAAAGILVAVPHSPAGPARATGPATGSATKAGTGAPPSIQELAYRASTAALTGPTLAPGQWVYMKKTQTMSAWERTKPVATKYLQAIWKDGYIIATTESWQTADALKITESDGNNWLRVESNPTLGKDISYAELAGFHGSPRALANYIFHRETQIQGPESASQTWFETYYEMAITFTSFVLPPRVAAEIFQALPYVPGVRVEKVSGGIAFSSAGVSIVLDPATYKTISVDISSGKRVSKFDTFDVVPVSGPGVSP